MPRNGMRLLRQQAGLGPPQRQLDVGCRTAGKRLFRISFGVIGLTA